MTGSRTWSVSAMRSYLACPRAWWLSYVAKVPQEPGRDSIRGQVLHAGVAAGFLEHARALTEGRALVAAQLRARAAVEHAVCRAATRLGHEEVDEAIDTAADAVEHLAPRIGDEVLGVEVRLDIELEGIPVTYRADALYRRGGRLVVRDWKSRSELPRRRDLPKDRQLALGALCAARTYGDTALSVEIASIGRAVAVDAPIERSQAVAAGTALVETAHTAAADTVFEPRPGAECARCKVREHCPVFLQDGVEVTVPGPGGRPAVMLNSPSLYVPKGSS